MEAAKIHSRYADTGHWLARCNHDTGLIELNRRNFPRLDALMKDYIWVHEYTHLLYDIYDEAECNAIADKIFIDRAKNAADREAREAFVRDSRGAAEVSGIAVTAIIGLVTTAVSLGVKGYQLYKKTQSDASFYALPEGDRFLLAKELMKAAFEAAPGSGLSAKDIFWGLMSQCSGDADYNAWLAHNSFANGLVADYEKAYGCSFTAKNTAAGLWSKPIVKITVVALAVVAAVLVARKLLKK